jgi:AcrR family transcriptional regulator
MAATDRRERERREMRTKILDAARELFSAEGYDAVTMRKVAERIEYSPTAIYQHFSDKTALIRELVTGDFLAFAGRFLRVASIEDPIERLREAGRVYVEFGLTHPHHYRLMFSTPAPPVAPDCEHRDDPARDGYAFLRQIIADCARAGRLRPELVDVDLVAQVAWAGVHGTVTLLNTHRDRGWVDFRDPTVLTETMLEALVHGIGR